MSATFLAAGTFTLKARDYFVVFGTIAAGAIRPGMCLVASVNQSLDVKSPILAVESLLKGDRSYVALCLRIENPVERQLWERLGMNDQQFQVQEAAHENGDVV